MIALNYSASEVNESKQTYKMESYIVQIEVSVIVPSRKITFAFDSEPHTRKVLGGQCWKDNEAGEKLN